MNETSLFSGDVMVSRNEGLLTAQVDGELMAMSVDRGICYGLNRVGTRIWELIAEPRTIDDLCARLMAEYEVDAAQCRSEVISLIEEFRTEGLATVRRR